jgi:hypothetical protein
MHTLLPRLRTILPLLVLLLISSVVLIALDRPLVRGDGTAYLAWVDTLIIDRDLSLQNQVDKLASVNTYQVAWNDATNDWAIVFPFGIAFLQAPFYALGHIFAQNDWLNYNPTYFFQNQGVALPYSLWLMAGANFMALGIISAAWWAGRRFANGWLTALTVFAVFIGTPLVYYSTIDPLNSHNGAGFTMAILIWILVIQTNAFARDDDDTHTPRLWLWVLMGIMAGMTIMTRWQLAVSVAPVWLLLAYKREWRGFWIAGISAAVMLLPLPYIWNAMFGAPFVIPFNEVENREFLQTSNQFLLVLENLLLHSPIVLLFFAGLPLLWRRDKAWALLFVVMFIAQLIVNGSALDWYAGDSYGMRRMSELTIIYAISATAFTGWLWQKFQPRWRGFIIFGYGIFIAYTAVYIASFLVWTWTNPEGFFIVEPLRMIRYWLEHPYSVPVLREVVVTHVSPVAWTMPGP